MRSKHMELRVLPAIGSLIEIDEDGRVWRIAESCRWNGSRPCTRRRAERLCPDGYMRVNASLHRERWTALAHRLVWVAARGPIPDGMEINHKDGDKTNNRLSNLEVVTPSENVRHSLAVLGRKRARGERHPNAVLDEATVRTIRTRVGAGETRKAVAHDLGVSRSAVERVVSGMYWGHVA